MVENGKGKKSVGSIFAALSFGAFFGAIAGMIFAPKSGKETREDISRKTRETEEVLKEKVGEFKERAIEIQKKAEEVKDSASVQIHRLKDEAHDAADKLKDTVSDAVEQAKETIAQTREGIEARKKDKAVASPETEKPTVEADEAEQSGSPADKEGEEKEI